MILATSIGNRTNPTEALKTAATKALKEAATKALGEAATKALKKEGDSQTETEEVRASKMFAVFAVFQFFSFSKALLRRFLEWLFFS